MSQKIQCKKSHVFFVTEVYETQQITRLFFFDKPSLCYLFVI